MLNVKSFRRTKISNALLVTFALSVAGIPLVLANDNRDKNNTDNTVTSADNRNANSTNINNTDNARTVAPMDPRAHDETTTRYKESQSPVSDTWITTKVKTQLLANEAVKGMAINVTTTNGVVTLAGMLDTQAQVDIAIALAREIEGVRNVDTRALKIRPRM